MKFPRNEVNVNNTTVTITETPGRPLLLLVRMAHRGLGLWDKLWDHLAEYFTVASFNLTVPSKEELASPKEIFTERARQCVEVARDLGHDKFHLFGWYGGAQVAMRCLVDFPEHLHSCILQGAIYNPSEMRPVEKSLKMLEVILNHGDLELYTYFWFLSSFTPDYAEKNFDHIEAMVGKRLDLDKGRIDTTKVFEWIKVQRKQLVTDEELDLIAVPTLLVAPAFDTWPPISQVRRLQAKIKTSELAVIPGGGAFVMIEDPDAFMAAAGRFLRAAARGDSSPARLVEENNTTLIIDKSQRVELYEHRSEKALVFLHGWLMSPRMWATSMEKLEGKIRCIAPWHPAHGGSGAPEYGFVMDRWTDWLVNILRSLGITQAVLAGHSMGGMLSLLTALKHPGLVRGLVLVGTTDETWDVEKSREFIHLTDLVAVSWGNDIAPLIAELLLGEAFLKKDPAWVGAWVNEVMRYDLRGMPALGRAIANREDLSGMVKDLNIPALVVHGGDDKAVETEMGKKLAARIPNADYEEIAGAAHCPPLEKPDIFNSKLCSFLKKHRFI